MPTQRDACSSSHEVPACDTGPAARWRFVAAELRDVGRELREQAHRSAEERSKHPAAASVTSKDGAQWEC